MKRRGAVAIAGFGGTLLGVGAVVSCGSRTGLPLEEAADAEPEHGLISPDRFVEEPKEEDAQDVVAEEVLPGIDVNRPDVPVFNPCPDAAATLIYVIGTSGNLYSFNPATSPGSFTLIGTISCPGTTAGSSPFSMAVDREGVAYVAFSNGGGSTEVLTGLFRVSTKTAECTPTPFNPAAYGNQTFGMGFVANVSDGSAGAETLYISADSFPNGRLGTIDTTTFKLSYVADYSPAVADAELTGTGLGQLFAFQPLVTGPGGSTTKSFIAQIDPATAKVVSTDLLPGLQAGSGWAFGFWGGDFYTFTAPSSFTIVNRFDPVSMKIVQVASLPGDVISGAGVSTCAPTVL